MTGWGGWVGNVDLQERRDLGPARREEYLLTTKKETQ
jgi:hypothetical protein